MLSLENVAPDISLERQHYHLLPQEELERLDDPEALFERGRRLRLGIRVPVNEDLSWKFIERAALRGHSLALSLCFQAGRGLSKDLQRGVELYKDAAKRGHPVGKSLPIIPSS